jgi:hypothetical protein
VVAVVTDDDSVIDADAPFGAGPKETSAIETSRAAEHVRDHPPA